MPWYWCWAEPCPSSTSNYAPVVCGWRLNDDDLVIEVMIYQE